MIKTIYPMLASGGKSSDKWDDPNWWAEEKIDGSRYLMFIGETGNRFTSRQKSRGTGLPVEKTENIPHLSETAYPELAGTILDGEIQHKDFSRTVSIMGSKPERAIQLQQEIGLIDYYVFDILEYKGENVREKTYKERRAILEGVVDKLNNSNIFATEVVKQDKKEFYKMIVERGGEGVILKNIDSVYVDNTRSKEWIKVKKYITDDVVIIGSEEPTRYYEGKAITGKTTWRYWESTIVDYNYIEKEMTVDEAKSLNYRPVTRAWFKGWIGAITFGKYRDGKLVELGRTSGIEDSMKEELSDGFCKIKAEFVGTVMEIGAMEQMKSGAYRHPRFLRIRPDKNAEDCIWEVR